MKNQNVHYQTLIEDSHCALNHGFHCALTQDYHFPTLDYLSETLQVLQGMDFCFQIQILKLLNSLMEMETLENKGFMYNDCMVNCVRERGMASAPKMAYQVFQKNSAMATLGLKEMGKFL